MLILACLKARDIEHRAAFVSFLAATGLTEATGATSGAGHQTFRSGTCSGVQIDYIAARGRVTVMTELAHTVDQFVSASAAIDHTLITVPIKFASISSEPATSRRRCNFDREAVLQPANAMRLRARLRECYVCDRVTEPTSECMLMHQQLVDVLAEICPIGAKKGKTLPFLSDGTFTRILAKGSARKRLVFSLKQRRLAFVMDAFSRFRAAVDLSFAERGCCRPCRRSPIVGALGRSAEVKKWDFSTALAMNVFKLTSQNVKALVRADRSRFIASRGERVTKAAELGYSSLLFEEIRFFKPRTVRPRGALANALGVAPASKAEEGGNVQAHLASLMQGKAVTFQSVVEDSRRAFEDSLPVMDGVARHAAALVGAIDLALQLRRAVPGKAVGPSLVPPKLLKAAPREVAAILEPLAIKIGLNVCAPAQWQGADVALIPKNPLASLTSAGNRREILLADLTAKAITARLRTRVAPSIATSLIESQHGGGFGAGSCPLAHMVVRCAGDLARTMDLAHATLFVDIRTAFASTIRQLVLPGPNCTQAEVEDLLRARGFPTSEAADIVLEASHIAAWGDVAPHLRQMVGGLSRNQYVLVDFAAGALSVEVGLLAGLSLADVSFAIAISRVSAKVRKVLDDAGLSMEVGMQDAHDLFSCPAFEVPIGDVALAETSIIDDVAYPIVCSVERLEERLAFTAALVVESYARHGFAINVAATKTAAIVTLRGADWKAYRCITERGYVALTVFGEEVRLPIVETYKHVGVRIGENGACGGDVAAKVGSMLTTARSLGTFVLRNCSISIPMRTALAESLIFTKGEFACGTWPKLHAVAASKYFRAVVQIARDVAGMHKWKKTKGGTDLHALVASGIPAPAYRLSLCRIALFSQLSQRKFWLVLAMIASTRLHRRSWSWALCADLDWLAHATTKFEELRGADIKCWVALLATNPKKVMTMARQAAMEATVRDPEAQTCPAPASAAVVAPLEEYSFVGPSDVTALTAPSGEYRDLLAVEPPRLRVGPVFAADPRFH